jgi:hypothetical protein
MTHLSVSFLAWAWHEKVRPVTEGAFVTLSTVLFADMHGTRLPLVNLREVRIPVGDDAWWTDGT